MNQLLFKDVFSENRIAMKHARQWQITSLVFCCIFALLGAIAFWFGGYTGEQRYLLLVAPIAGVALFMGIFIKSVCFTKQYLLIYTDVIRYQKGFSKKEKQLTLNPNEYKIKTVKLIHGGSCTIVLTFLNQKGKKLFSYPLSTTDKKREIYGIGCEIIDPYKYE